MYGVTWNLKTKRSLAIDIYNELSNRNSPGHRPLGCQVPFRCWSITWSFFWEVYLPLPHRWGPQGTWIHVSELLGPSWERPWTLFDWFCWLSKRDQQTTILHHYSKSLFVDLALKVNKINQKQSTKDTPSIENNFKMITFELLFGIAFSIVSRSSQKHRFHRQTNTFVMSWRF